MDLCFLHYSGISTKKTALSNVALKENRDLNLSQKNIYINWNGTFKGNFLYQIELVTYLIAISWVLMSAFNLLFFEKKKRALPGNYGFVNKQRLLRATAFCPKEI